MSGPGARPALVRHVSRHEGHLHLTHPHEDPVAVEEPLEIRVEGLSWLVTLRTPGHDRELAAGLLLSEGVIDGPDDLVALASVDDPGAPRGNTVDARLAAGVPLLRASARARFASSACGICGKEALDRIFQRVTPLERRWEPDPDLLTRLPEALRAAQRTFQDTGGLHAAALFSPEGELEGLREDVGRHNAVDKVIGWRTLQDRLPIDDRVLVVSGRAGFEIVQKAVVARIPALAALGAPSSMAVALAARAGLCLVGFLREGRYNLYDGVGEAEGVVPDRP